MNGIFHWVAEQLWPFYRSPLAFPEESHFLRTAVFRAARLAVECDIEVGVFAVIGNAYARRVARAWRPHEIHLLQDVSLAFYQVESRASKGTLVAEVHLQRLLDALVRYFDCVREPYDRDHLHSEVQRCIQELSELAEGNSE